MPISMTKRSAPKLMTPLVLLTPLPALASTTTDLISQLAGLFYIVIGLAVSVSCLLMFGGFVMWLARLGTYPTHRDDAIRIMEWGVATLFTVILVLGAVEFVQTHTSVVLYSIVIAIVLLVGWLIATSVGSGSEKKEETAAH